MKRMISVLIACVVMNVSLWAGIQGDLFSDGPNQVKLSFNEGQLRDYTLITTAELRDHQPADKQRTFSEKTGSSAIRTGNTFFDALYAMALDDARLNAVDQIRDGSFDVRPSMNRPYFQTGEKWTYVWTRDISYSVDLALAQLDTGRCVNSLLFKTTHLKEGIGGKYGYQIVQDTGSGGSYPVSTDRVIWALGAETLINYLQGEQRQVFLEEVWQILHDTIEHDRRVIYDPADGLYRGEQSFLDWREQTYPGWTRDNVLTIAESKALSTNTAQYILLKTASKIAGRKGLNDLQKKYQQWSQLLKQAINREFYIESEGLYSSLILDGSVRLRLNRFDLLGESLSILSGIADPGQAKAVVSNYPVGPYGPSVVWPQEQTVPIYHNQAIWPFVTAYWLKAARQVGNDRVIDEAVKSMIRGSTLNLSNMENYDYVTGKPYAEVNGISGPVINSRRQLWSVAGYLSMVQDVIFGQEVNWDGIRFLPCVTANMHRDYFEKTSVLELKNFGYRGTINHVKVYLPSLNEQSKGIYTTRKIMLNARVIDQDFVKREDLKKENLWEIYLAADSNQSNRKIFMIKDLSRKNIFGPKQPQWKSVGQGGITAENGKLILHFDASGEEGVVFNIYRNGTLCAQGITQTEWTDPDSDDYKTQRYFYTIEAVYPQSGNHSHVTPPRTFCPAEYVIQIGADEMKNTGGNLVKDHFENWGKPEHELDMTFHVNSSGTYSVNASYSNGAGPINTGVTCSVKRIEIIEIQTNHLVAGSYLIMPHTANWERYLPSSSFKAELQKDTEYTVHIYEDEYARNMSYFDHYEPYRGTGNGNQPYNYVNISNIRLMLQNE